jgi:hypothetical protein
VSAKVKVALHPFSQASGWLLLEWSDDDAFTVELHVLTKPRRGEGVIITTDAAVGGLTFAGPVELSAALVMTEAEARSLHAALEEVLAE